MTEAEWLTATDPVPMLGFVGRRAGDRKLRLLAATCTRRAWDRVAAPGRAAVELAERFADGRATPAEVRAARRACKYAGGGGAWYAAASRPLVAVRNAALSALSGCDPVAERATQMGLLRDVAGNPFRPTPFDARWRSADVLAPVLAEYEERAFDRLPLLAEALMDAGCDGKTILARCRTAGPHRRRCWVEDRVQGEQSTAHSGTLSETHEATIRGSAAHAREEASGPGNGDRR